MRRNYKAGLGRWLAVGFAMLAQPALAQLAPGGGASVTTLPTRDPADRLAANLVILSQNPRDLRALTEAGLSAIAVGDGNAALSFLARAEEISPRDGRIKAAIGSALLLMEKPSDALKLFGEAVSLGYPEQSVARDRGLAYDLRGDSRRAQRDYAVALRAGRDDDLTIRYALSLGISGDRDKALEMLDPLLRTQNLAAWRARAFVLAMNGDTRGAEAVASSVMPGGSGASMSPFLRRLAELNAAERALAVNFGIMPSDGQRYAMVETGDPYRPSGMGGPSDALIPAGDPLGPRPEDAATKSRRSEPVSKEPRRRPGRERVTLTPSTDRSASASVGATNSTTTKVAKPAKTVETAALTPATTAGSRERVGKRIGPVDPARLPPEARGTADKLPSYVITNATSMPPPSGAVRQSPPPAQKIPSTVIAEAPPRFEIPAETDPARIVTAPPNTAPATLGTPISSQLPPASQPAPTPSNPQNLVFGPPADQQPVREAPKTATEPQPAPAVATGLGLGAVLAGLQTEEESAAGPLPTAAEMKAARVAAQRKAAAEAKVEADAKLAREAKEAARLTAAKSPARIWVQVATGANESALPSTWKKLKDKTPAVFKGLSASSVPFKATNRLLVGPFKSQAEARALVNAMSKAGMSGSTFNSEAGQEIAKVASR